MLGYDCKKGTAQHITDGLRCVPFGRLPSGHLLTQNIVNCGITEVRKTGF